MDNNALPEGCQPTPPLSQHFALVSGVSGRNGKREAERGNIEPGEGRDLPLSLSFPLPLPPVLSKIFSLLTLKEGLIFSLLMNKFRFQGQAGPTPLIHRYCKEDLQLDEAKLITAQYMKVTRTMKL